MHGWYMLLTFYMHVLYRSAVYHANIETGECSECINSKLIQGGT